MTAKKASLAKSTASKETIYVDVDDEITNIIDKVKSSDHKIIALVLPKRAAVLQSVVNMKLLKKAGQNSKKSLVLITSEHGLLPLAGAAGLHVAKSLQSKPEIPPPPREMGDDEVEEATTDNDDEPKIDRTASIGSLAAVQDDEEVIELDNSKMAVDDVPKADSLKAKKNRKLKVPNFERFRLGIVLAVAGLVVLIIGWYIAFFVLPKATITISTDTQTVVSSFDFTASTEQPELDVSDRKIPAVLKEIKKTETEKVAATGERDDGTKAGGTITLSVPCASGDSTVVPANTTVSTGGNNYVTQTSAKLDDHATGPCRFTKNVSIIAAENGEKYNLESGKSFTISGYSGVSGRNGADITGGTSKIVKIVSQKDIDDAVAKISQRIGQSTTDELKGQLEKDGLLPLAVTFKGTEPKITSDPKVDKEASEVTVASEVTYTMLGVKREELVKLIEKDIESEIDSERQAITNDGIDEAVMNLNNGTSAGTAFVSFRGSVTAGPEFDEDALKEQVAGKKRGEIEKLVGEMPGVNDLTVEYSPFWVFSTPKSASKIQIIIQKAGE